MAYSPSFAGRQSSFLDLMRIYVGRRSDHVVIRIPNASDPAGGPMHLFCKFCHKGSTVSTEAAACGADLESFLLRHTHRSEEETDFGSSAEWRNFLNRPPS